MNAESFMNLVNEQNGFEFVIGFKNEEHYIGGTGNKYWYLVDTGRKKEYYIGTYEDGVWSDKFYVDKKDGLESSTVESGTTINKIVERAYFYQERTVGRKPQETEMGGFKCNHYCFGFGDKAVQVVQDYGVTVGFNDIKDNDGAYRLRDISTGKQVDPPKEN